MSKKTRVLGLRRTEGMEMEKLIYVHRNAAGETCVNGKLSTLAVVAPGEFSPADYAVIVRKEALGDREGFIAVGEGECLLWKEKEGVSVRYSGFIGVSAPVEFWRPIRVGLLTVSDKGSRGERQDTAGPALGELVEGIGGVVTRQKIVADERSEIAAAVAAWADEDGLELILSTGGTGFSPRDVTPEALLDIHDRIAPGIGEAMRARSMLHTPKGCLTRSLAVLRGRTLIISFPGSETAVRQCFEAIAPALRHAVEMASGWAGECASGNGA